VENTGIIAGNLRFVTRNWEHLGVWVAGTLSFLNLACVCVCVCVCVMRHITMAEELTPATLGV
jgi:type IV secretory pathway TrbD component